jgi:hypothetical protein
MNIKELGFECVDYIDLAQDRDKRLAVVYAVVNLQVT